MAGLAAFGCGQCLPCRINRRRKWQWRQWFESLMHEENAFVTLTYSDDHLPSSGSLEPRELQLWIKRLRKAIAPVKVRYLAVGEYGSRSYRPHYHLSLFGASQFTVVPGRPSFTTVVEESWSRGFVQVAEFNEQTAQYVAGYVVKKWNQPEKLPASLTGKVPEFGRMSCRPGLGARAMAVVSKTLLETHQSWEMGDVPREVLIGRKKVPLDRYLLSKLREAVGFSEEYIQEVRDAISHEATMDMLALYKVALDSEGVPTPRKTYEDKVRARISQVEARSRIFKKREIL